ncbi:MAG TPA: type II toxin-antitoxin system VapC family toxin [bacterium]|nr:type II toxin-antitoxin system VapC family toxin [bacterium]
MELNLLYDTNIFIYHFKNYSEVSSYFEPHFLLSNNIYISVITRIELLSYSEISTEEENFINNLLQYFSIIRLSFELENKTIELRKKFKLKTPDAIIAASAILNKATLLTRNTDDFQKVETLKIVNPFS